MVLVAQTRAVDARSRAFADALAKWAAAFVAEEKRRAMKDPRAYARRTKQEPDHPDPGSVRALRRLLLLFGLRTGQESANRAAGETIVRGSLFDDALSGKPTQIKVFQEWIDGADVRAESIAAETRERIRDSVREIIAAGDARDPRATIDDITRRIATTVHATEPASGAEPAARYVFSFQRAETIARTELAQVENTGRVAGYQATGIEEMEWLAYTDGKSGDRHHERMKGVRVKVGEKFTMPSGKTLRYPGDPLGDISETANCRCTVKPVRRKRETKA